MSSMLPALSALFHLVILTAVVRLVVDIRGKQCQLESRSDCVRFTDRWVSVQVAMSKRSRVRYKSADTGTTYVELRHLSGKARLRGGLDTVFRL